ncbi:MAG: 2,3-bisphosphoglycerate-independent phosphoglycerate mutase [Planctomycetota bacterium]|nr:MAG: 2,3-bisphosphoglycerate-independent phosphoglycerate mutase [Planctomycetota bacterium]
MSEVKPTLLLVLDGWGHSQATDWNAIQRAPAENYLQWLEQWPHALLSASGQEVGLPLGLMGNSEVGHTNIGAGRVVYQEISRIDKAIADGEFVQNGALRGAIEAARDGGGNLHLLGLVGNGGVHASDRHYRALLEMARDLGLPADRLCFHALLDGRDTAPDSGAGFVAELETMLEQTGMGRIVTLSGRYYAMDRDQRWERLQKFWDTWIHGEGERSESAGAAIQASYQAGTTDEFLLPTVIGDPRQGRLQDGDAVICFNFRADRVRQISQALLLDDFDGFERRRRPQVHYVTMTQYRKDFSCPVAYPPRQLRSLFGEVAAAQGLRQLRCAETEKYAHVTFFFNGGREEVYPGEERVLVPSPKVATYDLQPEMSAPQVTEVVLDQLHRERQDLYVVNFANADMVGHTGIQEAAEEAVRAVDRALGAIVETALAKGGTVAITADHGNAEMMIDPATGGVHTAHTTNPVPFLLIGEAWRGARLRPMGILADVAPTLLQTMGLDQPEVMDGQSLFQA